MHRCLELARQAAALGEVPVGAVVVNDGKLIGEGFNQPILSSDPSAHAEIQALRSAAKHLENYRLSHASLYVTVEPCTMCAGALIHARIGRLVFGTEEPRAGAVVSKFKLLDQDCYNHRVEYRGGVLAEECAELMRTFFRDRR